MKRTKAEQDDAVALVFVRSSDDVEKVHWATEFAQWSTQEVHLKSTVRTSSIVRYFDLQD